MDHAKLVSSGIHAFVLSTARNRCLRRFFRNDRPQFCDVSGQWSMLDLQPPVKRPGRAAVIDNKLYVYSCYTINVSVPQWTEGLT